MPREVLVPRKKVLPGKKVVWCNHDDYIRFANDFSQRAAQCRSDGNVRNAEAHERTAALYAERAATMQPREVISNGTVMTTEVEEDVAMVG